MTDSPRTNDDTLTQDEGQRAAARDLSLQNLAFPAFPPGYDVIRCLGSGSFGSVWLGRELNTGRYVAIKFFTRRRGLDWALLSREVEKLATLDASRDVVRLLDVGWEHDPPYFVMEYLEAGSVATRLTEGPLPCTEAVQIAKSVAKALTHAHGAGILHCDIKPANVLLDRSLQARLADFGQSRLATDQSPSLGTLYYMSPEQAQLNGVPDVRWDVYALGVLMYQMLTGSVPYRDTELDAQLDAAKTMEERLDVYRAAILAAPEPDGHRDVYGVDRELADIVDGCLDRDPHRRLSNAQVVLDLLERRELQQARRPLVWLGFLGPVLFALTLLWGAGIVIPRAVDQAETHLYNRALSSDAAAVSILAGSVQQDISSRLRELEELASVVSASLGEDPEVVLDDISAWQAANEHDPALPEEAPAPGEGRHDQISRLLDNYKTSSDRQLMEEGRTPDESLLLYNREGIQVFRNPRSETLYRSWRHRDYFHGQGVDLLATDDLSQVGPRTEAGISVAFRSGATGQFMVGLGVPLWNRERTEVIGAMIRTIHVTDLLLEWEARIRESSGNSEAEEDFFLSLVDTREHPPLLLDHQWMTPAHLRPLKDDAKLKQLLQLEPNHFAEFRRQQRDPAYLDPLNDVDPQYRGEWLAACADVGQSGWVAVVQERRSKAVEPMAQLYWLFFQYGIWMSIVFVTMLFLLWWIIQKVSRDG
ncbi:MAG: serine/threonine protein kinase [Planctomycetaceae bacterium]|nr:serine/threonine protein kinase [Planctomycetaceae bacterium]